jgi:hypothetical protein
MTANKAKKVKVLSWDERRARLMSDAVEYEELSQYHIFVSHDEDPYCPEESGNEEAYLGTFRAPRGGYTLGRKGCEYYRPDPEDEGYSEEDPQGTHDQEGYTAFPVELFDRGGYGTELCFCDPDKADGAIFVRTRTPLEQMVSACTDQDIAQGVLDDWNKYLENDFYRVDVFDAKGEFVEAYSSLDSSEEALENGRDIVKWERKSIEDRFADAAVNVSEAEQAMLLAGAGMC